MPELPEVETVVRGLRRVLPGRTITGVRLGKTDFIDDPAALEQQLPGSRISRIERFGKYIHLRLTVHDADSSQADSSAQLHLIIHLGMTGRLAVVSAAEPFPP